MRNLEKLKGEISSTPDKFIKKMINLKSNKTYKKTGDKADRRRWRFVEAYKHGENCYRAT